MRIVAVTAVAVVVFRVAVALLLRMRVRIFVATGAVVIDISFSFLLVEQRHFCRLRKMDEPFSSGWTGSVLFVWRVYTTDQLKRLVSLTEPTVSMCRIERRPRHHMSVMITIATRNHLQSNIPHIKNLNCR